ncbi:MAG: cardiolipin synthase [Planctomycetota bacterium]
MGEIILYASLLFEMLGLLCAADAVMNGRTPQGTVAWVAALIAIPPVAVPFYAMFGARRLAGYVRARRRGVEAINKLVRTAYDELQPFRASPPGTTSDPVTRVQDPLLVLPATHSNDTRVLIDGADTFAAIFAAIDAATQYVLIQFFIIHDDALGKELLKHLTAALARGVRVYFLIDSVGCKKLPRAYRRTLAERGAEVLLFRPSRAPRFRIQLNFRNHRKIVVADGKVGFIGGLNVGDEYMGLDKHFGPWRDTHMQITGPAVQALQMAFVEDWYCVSRRLPKLQWKPTPSAANARIAIVASGPADDIESCVMMFLHLIHSAHKRLWIATPYFIPDEAILAALQAAAFRGVDIRIIVPKLPDHPLVHLAARSYYHDAMLAGIHIHVYQKGFMHQKVALTDHLVAIGSANLDNRSLHINFEVTAVCDHAKLVEEVEAMLEHDLESCKEMNPSVFNKSPWLSRAASRLTRLVAPML